MGAYLSAREVVGLGVVWNTVIIAVVGFFLLKVYVKVTDLCKKVDEMDKKTADIDSIQRIIDSTIALSNSGKGSTSVEVKGGNANER